nr:SigB/SigF/SigG family RNA polymerase sigma factor [Tomitella fengzijianii]
MPGALRALRSSPSDSDHDHRRDEVITRCLPLAEHIARRFHGRGEPFDDLLQVARLGLVNAIDRFDADKGDNFVAFAVPTIMGEVRRHFRDTGWAMHVPRRAKELHLAISSASERLAQSLGRSPTAAEIARELGLPIRQVTEGLIARSAYQPDSMDAPPSAGSEGLNLGDVVGGEDPDLDNVEGYVAVKPHLDALPPRERRILTLRFFGEMTQSQIAERVGLSQMHVSRILARTLSQLRDELRER